MNPITVFRLLSRSRSNISIKGMTAKSRQLCVRKMSVTTSASISDLQRDKETFQDLFPKICDTITTKTKFSALPDVAEWLKKILECNLNGGKLTRGLATAIAYETLATPENFTEDHLKISRILGWCVEMLHAYFLIMDDIIDGSSKRRGEPCWYLRQDIGMGAINDSVLVHACIFELIKIHCSHLPQYRHLLELFNESLLYTTMGQHLDISMAHRNKDDYSLFTVERYNSIVQYKTAYYTYKLPVCLGMLLANITEPAVYKTSEDICLKIGHMFQMQDDYIDCYGVERDTGKIGTDIQERKCSWLAVQALKRLSPKQKTVFVTCYGSSEPAHVERIKRLYDELDLPSVYRQEERLIYDEVMERVRQLPENSQNLFIKLLDMINKRKK